MGKYKTKCEKCGTEFESIAFLSASCGELLCFMCQLTSTKEIKETNETELAKLRGEIEELVGAIVEFSEVYEEGDHCVCCERNSINLEKLEALAKHKG